MLVTLIRGLRRQFSTLRPSKLRNAITFTTSGLEGIYSRIRCRPWRLAATLLILITLGVMASSGGVLLSSLNFSDKIAAETAILTGAGLLLAVLAAAVAILAYRLSARVPELGLAIQLGGRHYDPASEPVVFLIDKHRFPFKFFDAPRPLLPHGRMSWESLRESMSWENLLESGESLLEGDLFPLDRGSMLTLQIGIRNLGDYTARNVAVRIEFLGFHGSISPENWQVVNIANPVVVQWEGGADYAVHGNWTRQLPPLNLFGLKADRTDSNWKNINFSNYISDSSRIWRQQHALLVEIVAEGYRKLFVVDARVFSADGWKRYWLAWHEEHPLRAGDKFYAKKAYFIGELNSRAPPCLPVSTQTR
jgi:hypothetical protein